MKPKTSSTKKQLPPRHVVFIAEYLKDLNATRAATAAGYSQKTAYQQGPRLLRNAQIARAVSEAQAKQLEKADLTATRVLEELRRLAFVDSRVFFDDDGNCKAIKDLTAEEAACLAGFEVLIKNAKAGDGITDLVHKFKLWDKPKALNLLARHFKLLTEVVEVHDVEARLARLDAGRLRAAGKSVTP